MDITFGITLVLIIVMGVLGYYTRMLFKSSRDQSEALREQTKAMNGLTEAIVSLQYIIKSVEMEEREFKEGLAGGQRKLERRIRRD